jgi:polar amino acid transport system permease protein
VIVDMLIGLPAQRPGGIVLTVLIAVSSGAIALVLGAVYATVCVGAPRLSVGLQAALAVLRGVPLLLLVFALAQLTTMPLTLTGFLALLLFSLCHVGETLRGFMAAYPRALRDQALILGYGRIREWACLRLPWTLRTSLDALATHWISLLKDTGTLTVLGIGELTTVARALSERAGVGDWELILVTAGLIYLLVIIILIQSLRLLNRKLSPRDTMVI